MWTLGLLVIIFVGWYLSKELKPLPPKKRPEPVHSDTAQPLAHNTPQSGPLTTDRDAKAAFEAGLLRRGYGVKSKQLLRETVADMGREMTEHRTELRDSIAYLKEEVEKQREYRDVIAEELQDAQEDRNPDGSDDEFMAKKQRHIGHLDREIGEMTAKLNADQAALKAFKADRASFVTAYLAHTLDEQPSPNRARQ